MSARASTTTPLLGVESSPEWGLMPKSWFQVVGTVVRMCFGGSRGLAVTDRHGSLCPVHRHPHDLRAPDPRMGITFGHFPIPLDLTFERRLIRLR